MEHDVELVGRDIFYLYPNLVAILWYGARVEGK